MTAIHTITADRMGLAAERCTYRQLPHHAHADEARLHQLSCSLARPFASFSPVPAQLQPVPLATETIHT